MAETLFSPVAPQRHEPPPIKGSRFVATVAPAASREEARAVIARVAEELSGARHVCWAWRIGSGGEDALSSDAGEPAGSAGRPILAQIEGHSVTNAVVVVARWFGGVKLGIGGLVRAYGGATGKCLDRARLAEHVATQRVAIVHPYECSAAVQGLLAAEGLEPAGSDYGESVRLEVDVPLAALERFERELRDRTAGRASVG